MTDVRAALQGHLEGMAAPFLFVGAGLSRRYASTDDWEGLLRRFAAFTSHPYDYYRVAASNDLPSVASKIAEEFYDVWWNDEQFADSRSRWAHEVSQPASALKVEIARHLDTVHEGLPVDGPLAEELELLRAAVVDGIITTNFDPLMESLFPQFRAFVGQDELLFSSPQGVGEIYKIHGGHSRPDSLVLTAEDYERFDNRNAYLAAKLLTIFVEQPVIFLGYGLQDRNVLTILKSIAGCLTTEGLGSLTDRLIFVQWIESEAPSMGPHTIMVDGFVIPVLRLTVPDFRAVFEVLGQLKRRFPAGLLRRLKEQVYDLVLSDDPHSRLVVTDIEEDTDDSSIDVVFGVGINARLGHHGYVALDRWNIADNVLSDSEEWNSKIVVDKTLPAKLAGNANLPVYKFLRGAECLKRKGDIKSSADVPERVRAMAMRSKAGLKANDFYRQKAPNVLADVTNIAELVESQGLDGVLYYAHHMEQTPKFMKDLREFLMAHRELRTGANRPTQYMKLVCLYDWMRYGRLLGQ